jgi:hypothetical protein
MPMISSRTRRPAAAPPVLREPEAAGLQRLTGGRQKQPQDTEQGCRAFAAADLASAGALTGAYPRARMEHSAASWTIRADLLHRLEAGIAATRRGRMVTAIAVAEAV